MKQLFHIDNPGETGLPQTLSLRIGEKYICYAITTKAGDQLHGLTYCTSAEWTETELEDFFTAYPALNEPFYQVLITYDSPFSSFVPFQDFKHEEAGAILSSLFGKATASLSVAEAVPEWQVFSVFAIPKEINDWVTRKFPSARCWHQYSVGARYLEKSHNEGHLLIDIRKEDFTLLAVHGGNLLLAQTYAYSTPEDVLYYLLRAANEFSLAKEECKVSLSGLVDEQSALYKELYQYFVHLEFRDASWDSGEYPRHFFTSLNDLARCVS
ncbi:MAG: DUF3822 family protein [Chitinophagaceae bacterium]|nr:DUF3822 family protein [Chitinophagaceae bacterium]